MIDAACDLLLNEGWWEIADVFKFREKETSRTYNTVAGTIGYNAAADLLGLQLVSIEDPDTGQHTPLPEMMLQEYETEFADTPSAEGRPQKYVRKAGQVLLWPTPDDIYEIKEDYWKTLADLAAGGADVPRSWHSMIWMNGAALGFAARGDLNKAYGYRKLAGLPSLADTKEATETKEKENRPYAGVKMIRPSYP